VLRFSLGCLRLTSLAGRSRVLGMEEWIVDGTCFWCGDAERGAFETLVLAMG
jgi:hypothetical protein